MLWIQPVTSDGFASGSWMDRMATSPTGTCLDAARSWSSRTKGSATKLHHFFTCKNYHVKNATPSHRLEGSLDASEGSSTRTKPEPSSFPSGRGIYESNNTTKKRQKIDESLKLHITVIKAAIRGSLQLKPNTCTLRKPSHSPTAGMYSGMNGRCRISIETLWGWYRPMCIKRSRTYPGLNLRLARRQSSSGLHCGPEKTGKIPIVIEDLSRIQSFFVTKWALVVCSSNISYNTLNNDIKYIQSQLFMLSISSVTYLFVNIQRFILLSFISTELWTKLVERKDFMDYKL